MNKITKILNKGKILGATALTVFAASAHAALPASIGTAITALLADIQEMFDTVLPAVILGLTLTIVITLLKRFAKKI